LRPPLALYGRTPAREFGPKALRAVQQEVIRRNWCRRNVNTQVNRIRSFFKWAVSRELIPPIVYDALRTVTPLKRGRCAARESDPVKPVPLPHVEAIRPFVSRQVWALVQLQLYTGARAGELVIMRSIDIDATDGGDWLYRPSTHKTEHHGHVRVIPIGPKGQQCLSSFLAGRRLDEFVFSAAEAEASRRSARHKTRATPLSCGNRPGSNVKAEPLKIPRNHYDVASYRRAIARASLKAGVPNRRNCGQTAPHGGATMRHGPGRSGAAELFRARRAILGR
jgi:integrase